MIGQEMMGEEAACWALKGAALHDLYSCNTGASSVFFFFFSAAHFQTLICQKRDASTHSWSLITIKIHSVLHVFHLAFVAKCEMNFWNVTKKTQQNPVTYLGFSSSCIEVNNKASSIENAAVSVNTPTWKMEIAFQKVINVERVIAHLCQLILALFYALKKKRCASWYPNVNTKRGHKLGNAACLINLSDVVDR